MDLNLGCPQRIAKRGFYGAFLMDDLPLVEQIVVTAVKGLRTPVSVKIRLFPELERTIAYARMLQAAGASLLAVHGRTREMKVGVGVVGGGGPDSWGWGGTGDWQGRLVKIWEGLVSACMGIFSHVVLLGMQ